MADRKISELSETSSVASGDVIVVVTGVGVGGATLTTTKLPMSGLMNHVVKIDEITTGGTGIHLVNTLSSTQPNTVAINTTGLALAVHTHTASDITDFSSAVSGEVQQIIKFQDTDLANTGAALVPSTDLSIPLASNSKYLDSVGTAGLTSEYTVVNNFTVQTTNNEADTISFGFVTNSVNQSTSGVLKKGSWLKAEKII